MVAIDIPQKLECPDLSPKGLVEHDAHLAVETEVKGEGLVLMLSASENRDLGLVSRLGEEGAILDAVQVTPAWFDNGTYCRVTKTFPDGSMEVAVSLLLGSLPSALTVKLEIFVSGVTFDDGTRTKILTADDIDENGHCTVVFLKARGVTTSVCHRTYLYQDDRLVHSNR